MEVFGAADAAAFRRAAEASIAYREGLGARAIGPAADYPAKLAALDAPLPERGMASDAVLEALVAAGAGGLMDMASPRFLGWVIGAAHPAGTAADMLVAGWSQVATMAKTSPAASALEEIAGRWLIELLRLPPECSFGLCTGATVANAVALAAARNEVLRRAGWDVEARGLFGAPEITVVVGAEVHSSVRVALRMLGLGDERVRIAAADDQGRMLPAALDAELRGVAGPAIVIAQAGNINSGALDPMAPIADLAAGAGAWLHVDGAFGLWANAHPELWDQAEGVERADSWAVDGHKWLQVPYDCGFVFVRDGAAHKRAMGHSAAYLPNSETLRDPGDYVPELSRRARGVPVWAVLKALGREGVLEVIGRCCRLARGMADRLGQQPGITVLNEVRLNQVALSFGPEGPEGDAMTRAVLQRVQAEGACYPSHGQWRGRQTIRLSVSGFATSEADADIAVAAILAAWEAVRAERDA